MVTKGEIPRLEQFLLLLPCFQLLFFHLKGVYVLLPRRFQSRLLQIFYMWERVKIDLVKLIARGFSRSTKLRGCLKHAHS